MKTVNIHAPMAVGYGQDRRWSHEVTCDVQSLSTGSPVGRPYSLRCHGNDQLLISDIRAALQSHLLLGFGITAVVDGAFLAPGQHSTVTPWGLEHSNATRPLHTRDMVSLFKLGAQTSVLLLLSGVKAAASCPRG